MRRSMAWDFTADLALERAAMKPIFDQFFETLSVREVNECGSLVFCLVELMVLHIYAND